MSKSIPATLISGDGIGAEIVDARGPNARAGACFAVTCRHLTHDRIGPLETPRGAVQPVACQDSPAPVPSRCSPGGTVTRRLIGSDAGVLAQPPRGVPG
jgi:hypothetical protein